jgi:hypothetical protein
MSDITRDYLTVTEVAKLVRAALKAAFPIIKFSVRSSSYSMGASIRVCWTDGPVPSRVDDIVQAYAVATFDGMQDLKEYKPAMIVGGRKVRSHADFIFCERTISEAGWQMLAKQVAAVLHVDVPTPEQARSLYPVIGSTFTFSDYVYQVSRDRTRLVEFFA